MDIWIIFIALISGVIIGLSGIFSSFLRRVEEPLIQLALLLLLLAMGVKIGSSSRIFINLGRIGLTAFLLSFASVAGSIFLVKLLTIRPLLRVETDDTSEDIAGTKVSYRLTGLILAVILLGVLIGYFFIGSNMVSLFDRIVTFTLGLLLFAVGISLGLNKEVFTRAFKSGWKILLIPLAVAAGSIAGPMAVSFILAVTPGEAAAVGAGFGWYSLSAILLTELHSPELGTIAFMSNTFREIFTFIALPVIAKYLGKAAGIATGGATTMDVTLPLIKKVSGDSAILPAFISGAILSGLVPILVPLLINL